MAVEIKELVIRAVVDAPRKPLGEPGSMSPKEREQLIMECVEEMHKIMKRQQLR